MGNIRLAAVSRETSLTGASKMKSYIITFLIALLLSSMLQSIPSEPYKIPVSMNGESRFSKMGADREDGYIPEIEYVDGRPKPFNMAVGIINGENTHQNEFPA